MPFRGNRGPLLIGIIALIVVVGIAGAIAISASAPPATVNPVDMPEATPPQVLSFTLSAEIGVEMVSVTNLNTQANMHLTVADLPCTYNCNCNDILVLNVTTKDGFIFDHWDVDDGTWESDNPLSIKVTRPFSMIAQCLAESQGGKVVTK